MLAGKASREEVLAFFQQNRLRFWEPEVLREAARRLEAAEDDFTLWADLARGAVLADRLGRKADSR